MLHGWEAHVYRLQLQGELPLPAPYDEALSVRAYDTPLAVPRANHEFVVMHALRDFGYPTPNPLRLESDCRLLGGPFLVSPWVEGITLLDWLRRGFTRVLKVAGRLAQLHLALHALPPLDSTVAGAAFLDKRLHELERMIADFALDKLAPGLHWLQAHRPAPPASPSNLHLDFHPVNIIVDDGEPRAVLDWSEADVGDRHADIGMTLVLLRTAPVLVTTRSERLLRRPARWLLARRYLRVYQRSQPLDPVVLRYYVAWASLRRLAVCQTWRRAGPWVHGFKTSARQYANPVHEAALRRVFWQATGRRLQPSA
jgi:aminoglycoside phosphotransferase (APT) family kinase protein